MHENSLIQRKFETGEVTLILDREWTEYNERIYGYLRWLGRSRGGIWRVLRDRLARRKQHRTHELRRRYKDGRQALAHEIGEIFESYLGMCAYCFSSPATTVDHIIALASGGDNSPANLVPACRSCNSSKGKKSILQWLAGRKK